MDFLLQNATNTTGISSLFGDACTGSIVAAVASAALLAASELLPFVKGTDSNGVLHLVATMGGKFLKNVGQNARVDQEP
jgi:H+/gluconate symporter-like permease